MMCVAQRNRECVGRVGSQASFDIERAAHHMSHLHLVRAAETYHRELDRTRRIFGKLNRLTDRCESRTTSLPELQGAIDITTDEDLLYGHLGRSKLRDQLTHAGMDTGKTRLHLQAIDFDATLSEAALRSGSNFKNAEARPPRARVEPEDTNRFGQICRHSRWRRASRRSGGLWIEGAPRLGAISRHASATPKKRLENQLRMILRNGDAPCKLPSLFPRR